MRSWGTYAVCSAAIVALAEAGQVISPDDAGNFVKTARGLMENDKRRARYAANARAYAERSFDIVRIADRFLDVIATTGCHEHGVHDRRP